MKTLLQVLLAAATAFSFASTPLFAAGRSKILIDGSNTIFPITQVTAEEFMDDNPDVNIIVRGGGSGIGITALIEGTVDIADSSRAMKEAEIQKAASRGVNPKAHVIAMDGIAVIANPSNPVGALTKKQVMDIYTGKVSNWSQLGGKNEKIVVISRDSASGTFEAFGELALNKQKVRADALLQASSQGIATMVSRTSGAIGYVGIGYVTDAVKALTINGVEPTVRTVLNGKYPYSRPLYMYTNGAPQGAVKAFIDFIRSAEGQKLVEQEGFIAFK